MLKYTGTLGSAGFRPPYLNSNAGSRFMKCQSFLKSARHPSACQNSSERPADTNPQPREGNTTAPSRVLEVLRDQKIP